MMPTGWCHVWATRLSRSLTPALCDQQSGPGAIVVSHSANLIGRCKMRGVIGKAIATAGVAGLLVVSACGSSDEGNGGSNGGSADKKVQVFTWWADGGEKAGLDGLVSQFQKDCPNFEFDNAAVAGGAG